MAKQTVTITIDADLVEDARFLVSQGEVAPDCGFCTIARAIVEAADEPEPEAVPAPDLAYTIEDNLRLAMRLLSRAEEGFRVVRRQLAVHNPNRNQDP